MLTLSPTEKEIMELLWKTDGMTNNELIEYFESNGRALKRQTTNAFFTRLVQKGVVVKKGRKYLARYTKDEFTKMQTREVLDMYGGSLKNFIAALYCDEKLTEEEGRKLDELIDLLER